MADQEFCRTCGGPNAPDAEFCAKCGVATVSAATPIVISPQPPPAETKEVEQILHFLSCSDLRNNLAQALRDGKKMTLAQLSEHVGASSSACVHSLRELTEEHVTRQDKKRNYSLTNIGEIVTRKIEEFNTTITALSRNREFWLDHDLSGIPKHLLDKIGNLADYEIISVRL